jgi:hypothetical protein
MENSMSWRASDTRYKPEALEAKVVTIIHFPRHSLHRWYWHICMELKLIYFEEIYNSNILCRPITYGSTRNAVQSTVPNICQGGVWLNVLLHAWASLECVAWRQQGTKNFGSLQSKGEKLKMCRAKKFWLSLTTEFFLNDFFLYFLFRLNMD